MDMNAITLDFAIALVVALAVIACLILRIRRLKQQLELERLFYQCAANEIQVVFTRVAAEWVAHKSKPEGRL